MLNWMPIEAAALLVSLCFAIRNIFVRSGQRFTTPLISTFAITLITALFLLPATLAQRPGPPVTWIGVFWYILAGITAPGLALLLFFASVNRIGVARASPIASIQPLITLVIAVLFLGERPSIPVYVGTVLVVGGIVLLTTEKQELKWTLRELALPLSAAILWSVSSVLRKVGMREIPWETFGGLVISVAALITLIVASPIFAKEDRWRIEPAAIPYLLAAGGLLAAGFYFHLFALGHGTLARVAPLANTSPIMTVFLTAIFLKRLERVTLRLIISTLIIFLGGALITVY
jgi:drug/metabolite transporter (DMT)-like permease